MENSTLQLRITSEIENLISKSCSSQKMKDKLNKLHVALLKKYYNAAVVKIDYHRKRIAMEIVVDDAYYDPKKINTHIPTFHANFIFMNLKEFLHGCIDKDTKSLGFYAGLLRTFAKKDVTLTIA